MHLRLDHLYADLGRPLRLNDWLHLRHMSAELVQEPRLAPNTSAATVAV